MATTAQNLIDDALQEIGAYGAGETVTGDDTALCLEALNALIDSWALENLLIYAQQEVTATLPAATSSRTIGPGLQINTTRPVRLEDGCFVRVGNLDFPLNVVTQAEFNAITQKTVTGPWPSYCVYDDAYPTGTIDFWPQGACTLHLNLAVPLSSYASATTSFAMPPGYRRAMALSLAEEVATKFGRQVSAMTAAKAKAARRSIRRANLVVPQLDMGEESLPSIYAIKAG